MNDRLASLASARPMVVVASAFIFGILSKEYLQIGAIIFICLIPLASLFAFVPHPKVQQWSLLLLIALSGGLRLLIHDMPRPASLGDYPIKTSENYYVRSIVLDIGETRKGTPKYTLAPLSIDDNRIVAGRMILYAKDLALLPQMGDTLSAEMNLQKPRNRRNPNDFDYQQYLFNQGIFLQGFIADTNSVEMSTAEGFIPDRFINSMRGTIKSHFIKYLSPRSAGIMSALILGERSDVNDETKNDFANTGVIHVLAVSGLHVGYVSLILITILGMLRLPYRPKLVLVIIGLVCYVILTGGAASVMRASMMAALILLASMLERKTDVFNILATAAFLILLIDPSQIKSIGFQLSFSAVFSIVTLFPELRSWIPKVQFQRQVILSNFINALVDLFLVSLAAQLGTLALTMYYFQKIPIISLLANLLVVPLIGVIVATGISSLLLGSVFPALAVLWAALLDGVIDFMLLFVQVCARFRWAYYSTGSIQYVEVILLLIAVFAMLKIQGYRLLKLWIILILTWFNLLVWPAVFRPGDMELIMLDVGQGDASIIHT
ncbi:DNA internalization-related competence protein ComEC/Rec2, partial [bacterium]|nr:DNA internalization-related competence protein ComEC/Rec2 [bacterium]